MTSSKSVKESASGFFLALLVQFISWEMSFYIVWRRKEKELENLHVISKSFLLDC